MNVVCFSLYGESKLYCRGALENVPLVHQYYPGFIPRFYVAKNCPALKDLQREESLGGCEVVLMPDSNFIWGSTCSEPAYHNDISHCNMTWRYQGIFDKNVDIWLGRDTDSRVNPREVDAVQQWLESGLEGHIIYEDESHWTNGGIMPFGIGLRTQRYKDYPDGYNQSYEFFNNWYQSEGILRGVKNVHMDIWFAKCIFFDPLDSIGQVFRSGYNTNNPLRVDMPQDGSLGNHCGSVVNEEWRYLKYEYCTSN